MHITPRAARVNKGLTQAEVAQIIGVSTGTVQRIEVNARRVMADHVIRYAEVVGLDPNDIFASSNPSKTGMAPK